MAYINTSCFEVKESRKKFLFLGIGALIVGLPLLAITPRILSVITLAGIVLASAGGILVYKAYHLKTILKVTGNGLLSHRYGDIPWMAVEACSAETISRNSLFTIQCTAPYGTVLIDLSMSDLASTEILKQAIVRFSGRPELVAD